jgi:hypothetical protein
MSRQPSSSASDPLQPSDQERKNQTQKQEQRVEQESNVRRWEVKLKESSKVPMLESSASSPSASQPDIKQLAEPVSSGKSLLSQSSQTLMPSPHSAPGLVDQKALSQLLQYVVEGEQDKAETLIQKDPNLLLHMGTVTDLSGREFKGITAFQYALWALDWHMWQMIQRYLPTEAQVEQLNQLESKGTTYGKHFSFEPLINALQVYVTHAEKKWDYDERAEYHWQTLVGGAQKLLPAHVINEYCRPDRSFAPCPAFTEETLPRTRKFSNGSEWFMAILNGGKLGEKFGAFRACINSTAGGLHVVRAAKEIVAVDLRAIQSLSETRVQQLNRLVSQLQSVSSPSVVTTTL